MSKKIGILALVFVAGLAGYNYVTTGKVTLIPSSAGKSPEEQHLSALESRMREAGAAITRASQAAGVTGMDTTGDVERAMSDLERIEGELQTMRDRTQSAAIREKCDRLAAESRSMRGAR